MKCAMRLLLCFVFFSVDASAQQGFPPFGSFEEGGFDAINRQNLNVNFTIPVMQVAGRGFGLDFGLSYNSLVWTKSFNSWAHSATWGWNKSAVISSITHTQQLRTCSIGGQLFRSTRYYNYAVTEPDGTRHPFAIDFLYPYVPCEPNPDISSGYATDNSGFSVNASNPASTTAGTPSGLKITTDSKLFDSNGNFVSHVISANVDSYTDTVGRVSLKIDTSVANQISYKYLDVNGNYQTIMMFLSSFNIKTNFGCSIVEYTENGVSLPTSISLPNGRSYTFQYEDTPGFSGYKTGRLSSVTLPTGGSYSYSYPAPNNGMNCSDGTVRALTRTITNGTATSWTYVRSQVGTDWKTTVTPPVLPYDTAANVSTFTFNSSGQLTSQKYYQGAELSPNLLRTINTTWAVNNTPASTLVTLENNQQSKVETDFDTTQKLLEKREFHWGTGGPGGLVRKTTISYFGIHPTQIVVRDGSTNLAAQTNIFYDETTPASCPANVPQHDDTNYGCSFNLRQNPTRIRRYKDVTNYLDTTMTYDSLGNLLSQTDPGLHTTNFSYADSYLTGGDRNSFAYLTRITKPAPFNSQTINFKYHYNLGALAQVTDENTRTTSFTFADDAGTPEPLNRLKKTDFPDGGQTKIVYNDASRTVTQNQKRTASPTDDIVTVQLFDQLGQLVQNQLPGNRKIDISYDPLGRQWKVSNPYVSLTEPTYGEVQTKLDGLGRQKTVVQQDSNSVQYVYAGNAAKVTDESGKQRITEKDALGRTTKACEVTTGNTRSPNESCGIANFSTVMGYATSYTFDTLDNIKQATQGAQTRTSSYDFLSRTLTSLILEVSSSTSVSYGYDADGNVTSTTDPRGTINFEYDELHRPRKTKQGTTVLSENTYDGLQADNAIGRLKTETDGAVGTADKCDYIYDAMGRVKTSTRTVSGTSYAMSFTYDYVGSLLTLDYPTSGASRRKLQYAYNSSAELNKISDITGTSFDYVAATTYSPIGSLVTVDYGNSVRTTLDWNKRGRLTSLFTQKTVAPTQTHLDLDYTYNTNGQLFEIVNNLSSLKYEKFTYDELLRLLTAQRGLDSNIQRKYSYDYDRYGNRWLQTVVAGSGYSGSNSFNSATNRVTTSGFSYDNSGNITANGPGTSYTYDQLNRMTAAGTTLYKYDAQGRRVRKTVGATVTDYFYLGAEVIAEKQGSSWTDYVFFAGKRTVKQTGSTLSTATFIHTDHLNSTRSCSDSSGNSAGTCDYDPFGQVQPGASCSLPVNYRFTGMEWDSETGLYRTSFRYYDVLQGRWMSVDPLPGDPDDPQSANRYAYVLNDPANLIDPLGLLGCPPGCTEIMDSKEPVVTGCNCSANAGDLTGGQAGNGSGGCNPNLRVSPGARPGQCTDASKNCNFNVAINNKAKMKNDSVEAIKKQIAAVFAATSAPDGSTVGVNFSFSGTPDTTLNLTGGWVGGLAGLFNIYGVSGPGTNPTVFTNAIYHDYSSNNIRVDGIFGAHELTHKLGKIRDLTYDKKNPNLMSLDYNPDQDALLTEPGLPQGLRLTPDQIRQLYKECKKLHP